MIKKQCVKSNEEWIEVFNKSTELYSQQEIKSLENYTIANVRDVCRNYKNVYSGWIGGKDSVVLHDILLKSGIPFTPIKWEGVNPWPCVADWEKVHRPHNLEVEVIEKFNLDFLEKHNDYLFCQNPHTAQLCMREKWARYKVDLAKRNCDLFITGRRLSDGNICGTIDTRYVRYGNLDQYSPLAEWTAEQLFAYIKYNDIELSPFYSFPRGFLVGSIAMGDWTEYACKGRTVDEVWREIYDIDKSIVIGASEKLTSAKLFMQKIIHLCEIS